MTVLGDFIELQLAIIGGYMPRVSPILPLPDALNVPKAGEHFFQQSLSRHTQYFPLLVDTHHGNWFSWILCKYELPNKEITDFAYVVTTSNSNTVVLVEIEDPEKGIWVGSAQRPSKSAAFSDALEQVERWRSHLEDPSAREKVISEMKQMMGGSALLSNNWDIKYVLIYGRSKDNASAAQKRAFSDTQKNSGIHLATYDNLISAKDIGKNRAHNVVSLSAGNCFSYLFLNREPRNEFAYLSHGRLTLTTEVESVLSKFGYDIASWKSGELLTINGKHPSSKLQSLISSGITVNILT